MGYQLESNESKLLERRKHWFIIVVDLIGVGILALIPFILYGMLIGKTFTIGAQTIVIYLPTALFIFLGSAWLLIFWMRAVGVWTDYYLDVWTITNKRIIDQEQKGFFHRETSIFRLDRIQDVTVETHGIIQTLLHFGDIHVQTAGERRKFIMHGIANPRDVRAMILRAQDAMSDRYASNTEQNQTGL